MPNKYQHNSERWLRNNAEIYTRMGSPQVAQKMALCADEVKRLKGELAALKEAVNWERECEHAENYINARDTKILVGARREWWDTYKAARAEVDRLIANESAADCKGEG